ncbi:ABC transporter substrate-binding protein [Paenibacillus glycanilyticus]|uniref:Sugar ABC transporter substrate-binding protein n=1 Tax=Paenibacillus glycanilyticus TaxID=126569 RepID=A0ABQ6NRN6_9BACL|nr:ABC transporter substrate-binding protein [Paenibacillus glycanilyticus]GMK47194.1 sugar ABC transporter substrate-binding protein [Paenibacillus glycanilyticus]
MKKKAPVLLTTIVALGMLSACSTGQGGQNQTGNSSSGAGKVTTIEFWAAPNPTQQAYWQELAKAYEATNDKVKINVSAIKESPTSEASIQSAIAAKSAPTISENINRGFAAQLSNSQALVPLDTLEGYNDIIQGRNMTKTIEPWKFADGHQYVLPIYSNPMLFGWRLDVLKELGYNEPPKTYSEVLEVTKKLKAKYGDKKFLWAKPDLADPTAWKRWFDFYMLYDAASNGNKFIEGDQFTGDEKAGTEVLTFVDNLRKENGLLSRQVTDPFENGTGIFTDVGPWTFTTWAEKYPNLKFNETYALSMPPVPDDVDPAQSKTFADTKGLVIYASATKEQQQAALDFIKWVYSDAKNDAKWFEQTNLPPARDDLSTNESFKAILDAKPQLKPYADNVPNAVPPMDNAKYNDLQTIIGEQAFNKVVKGEIAPTEGWAAMKSALEKALK